MIDNLNILLNNIQEQNTGLEKKTELKIIKTKKSINYNLKKIVRKKKNIYFFIKEQLKTYIKFENNYAEEILKLKELNYCKDIEKLINNSEIFDYSLIKTLEEFKKYILLKIYLYHNKTNKKNKTNKANNNNDKNYEADFNIINNFIDDNENIIIELFNLKNSNISNNLNFPNNFYYYKENYLSIIESIDYLEIDNKLKELNNFLDTDFTIDNIINNNVNYFLKEKFENDKNSEFNELELQKDKYLSVSNDIDKTYKKLQESKIDIYIIIDKIFKIKLKKYFLEKKNKSSIKYKNNNINFDKIENLESELEILDKKLLELKLKKNNKNSDYTKKKQEIKKKKEKTEILMKKIINNFKDSDYKFKNKLERKVNEYKKIISDINDKLKIIEINDDIDKNYNQNFNSDIDEQIIKINHERDKIIDNKNLLIIENNNFYRELNNIKINIKDITKVIDSLELEKTKQNKIINNIENNLKNYKKNLEDIDKRIRYYENKIYLPENKYGLNLDNIKNYVIYLTNSEIYKRKQEEKLINNYSIFNFIDNIHETLKVLNNLELFDKKNLKTKITLNNNHLKKNEDLSNSITYTFNSILSDVEIYKICLIKINIIDNFKEFLDNINNQYIKNKNINVIKGCKEDLRNILINNNFFFYNNTKNFIKDLIRKIEELLNTGQFKSIIFINKNLNIKFEQYNKLILKKKLIDNNNLIIQKFKEEINIINNILNNSLLNG